MHLFGARHYLPEGLLSDRLVGGFVVLLQIRMSESLFHRDSFVRVEGQHLVQQVEGFRIRLGKRKDKSNVIHIFQLPFISDKMLIILQ